MISYCILSDDLTVLQSAPKYYDGLIGNVYFTTNMDKFVALIKAVCMYSNVFLIAHNGHKFDHFYVLDALDLPVNPRINTFVLLSLPCNGHEISFGDTRAWFTMPLKALGNIVGLKKLDLDLRDPVYCCRDTEIVVAAIKFINDYLLPVCHISQPYHCFYGIADATYRYVHSFLDNSMHFNWSITLFNELSACFYGGRVDSCMYGMFFDEEITCLDITSMYPSSLCRKLPAGNLSLVNGPPPPDLLSICYVTVHKETASCSSACFGIMPVHLNNTIAFFDYGTFDGWYTSTDLDTFKLDGWSVQYHCAYVFDSSCTLEPVYMKLYKLRKAPETIKQMDYAYKIAMNSSYGKFAQFERAESWCTRIPYIAWWCLAYSRVQLFHMKQMARHTTILYGDTDSIFIPSKDVPQMKKENPQYFQKTLAVEGITLADEGSKRGLIVLGKKSYCHGDTLKYKGFIKDNLCKNEFRDALLGEEIVNIRDGISKKSLCNGLCFIDKFRKLKRRGGVNIPVYKTLCTNCHLYH